MNRALLPVALVFLGSFARASHDDSFTKDGLFKADVNELKDTQLVAHPDVPLDPSKNVLWCGTLQLAWNEAVDLVGEKLTFTTPSPEVALLNRLDFNKRDLAPGSYVAVADFERNNVEDRIRRALENVFHGAASPELIPPKPAHPGPSDFVAYSYLYKSLEFAHPFQEATMAFAGHTVKDFGLGDQSTQEVENQIELCDYQSDSDFVVRLKTTSPDDELILAKVSRAGLTLADTIHFVLKRAGLNPLPLGSEDEFRVPALNFDLRRDFKELEGLVLKPSAAAKVKDPLVISQVQQLVRFQLNKSGAVLKSEANIVAMAGSAANPPPHRHLIFDRPFLILLKQKASKEPYFALWVGNAKLLSPPPAADVSPVTAKLSQWIVNVDWKEITFEQAIEDLQKKSVAADPEHDGLKFESKISGHMKRKITIQLENVPLSDVLGYLAQQTAIQYKVTEDGVVFFHLPNGN